MHPDDETKVQETVARITKADNAFDKQVKAEQKEIQSELDRMKSFQVLCQRMNLLMQNDQAALKVSKDWSTFEKQVPAWEELDKKYKALVKSIYDARAVVTKPKFNLSMEKWDIPSTLVFWKNQKGIKKMKKLHPDDEARVQAAVQIIEKAVSRTPKTALHPDDEARVQAAVQVMEIAKASLRFKDKAAYLTALAKINSRLQDFVPFQEACLRANKKGPVDNNDAKIILNSFVKFMQWVKDSLALEDATIEKDTVPKYKKPPYVSRFAPAVAMTANDKVRSQKGMGAEARENSPFGEKVGPEQEKEMAALIKEINGPELVSYQEALVRALKKLDAIADANDGNENTPEAEKVYKNDSDAKKVKQLYPVWSKWLNRAMHLAGSRYSMPIPKYPVNGFTNSTAQSGFKFTQH